MKKYKCFQCSHEFEESELKDVKIGEYKVKMCWGCKRGHESALKEGENWKRNIPVIRGEKFT